MIYLGYGCLQQEKYYRGFLKFPFGSVSRLLSGPSLRPFQGPAPDIPGAADSTQYPYPHHLHHILGPFGIFHTKVLSQAYKGRDFLLPAFSSDNQF